MKRWTVGGDVVLHAMLVGVRGTSSSGFVYSSVESVNAHDVQTTDGGGGTGHVPGPTMLRLSRLMRCLQAC